MANAPKRILVIDDDVQVQKLLGQFLTSLGYAVTFAADGIAGLEQIDSRPDLVILDVNMPRMNGITVLDVIRSPEFCELGDAIPVFLLTAHAEKDVILDAATLGVEEFIIKPFDLDDLAKKIARELGKKKAA